MRDSLYDDVASALGLVPVVRSANGVVNGPSVDLAGNRNNFRVAMLVAVAGGITDGTHTITVEESDNGTTGWTVATNTEGAVTYAAASQNTTKRMGIAPTKRYLRAVITTTGAPGTPVGGTIGAIFLLTQGSGRPIAP